MPFCDCLSSLSMMSSRFTRAVVCVRISWLFKFGYYSVYIHHILFTHSSIQGRLGSVHLLVIVNKGYAPGCTHICWNLCFHFFWVNTQKWNPRSYSNSILSFLKTCHPVFHRECILLLHWEFWCTVLFKSRTSVPPPPPRHTHQALQGSHSHRPHPVHEKSKACWQEATLVACNRDMVWT